ncbi:DinB superfamily protein [Chitinophaga sp. YR573]|uniref:DinB family protein n=1 Tax=Chitinophaga sp. YR573 TaxID=1881040 RepID=UPI0008B3F05D|nr:DinB family protein [Chitinophaga sp. YR573]SEW43983.1 DinB superfamily protein [Chitinophaga sp. YR573]
MPSLRKIMFFSVFNLITAATCFGQQSLSSAIERQFNKIENDILTTAEAMPESRFNFTPESLNIENSTFKGVRTFAGQIMHLATDNILIWSAITGDSVRADIEDVNGPKSIKTKKDIIEYLKSSFTIGRKAISTLTNQNAMDMIDFRWRKLPRLDLAFYALTHANEHYGQMTIYLRMCGIVPPATLSNQ